MTQVALISGAAHGIGHELARQLAARGMRLALVDAHADALARVAAELPTQVEPPLTYALDVGDMDAVRRMTADVLERCGQVNLCAPVAGLFIRGRWSDVGSEELLERGLDVNLRHPVRMCNEVLRAARLGGWPCRFVFAGSDSGLTAPAGEGPYAASKAALAAYALSLADELRHEPRLGVTFGLIFPTRTRIGSNTDRLLEPHQRTGPADVEAVDRFLSENGDDVTAVVERLLRGVERGRVFVNTNRRPRRQGALRAALQSKAYWRDDEEQARSRVMAAQAVRQAQDGRSA